MEKNFAGVLMLLAHMPEAPAEVKEFRYVVAFVQGVRDDFFPLLV